MNQSADVVVVGGGAAGCAVAYYLGKAGVKAILVEREGVGTQASGYAAGGVARRLSQIWRSWLCCAASR